MSLFTKCSIAFTKSVSDIASVAHHPAVFFTQSGIFSALAIGKVVMIPLNAKIVIMLKIKNFMLTPISFIILMSPIGHNF